MGVQMHAWRLGDVSGVGSTSHLLLFATVKAGPAGPVSFWRFPCLSLLSHQQSAGVTGRGLCPGFHVGSGDPNLGLRPVWQVPWSLSLVLSVNKLSLSHRNLEPQ